MLTEPIKHEALSQAETQEPATSKDPVFRVDLPALQMLSKQRLMCNSHKFARLQQSERFLSLSGRRGSTSFCEVAVHTLKHITASTHKRNSDKLVKSNAHDDSDAGLSEKKGRHVQRELVPVTTEQSKVRAAVGKPFLGWDAGKRRAPGCAMACPALMDDSLHPRQESVQTLKCSPLPLKI